MDNREIIESVKSALKPIVTDGEVMLYGSRARGDYRKDSDVDIMILLPDEYHGKKYAEMVTIITEKLYKLELEWNMEIDISPVILPKSVFNKRKTPFTINVMNEGKLL